MGGGMILRAIRGNEGTWEPTGRVRQKSHSIREAEMAGFCPLLFSSFFFPPPSFPFRPWVFCLCVCGVERSGTKTDTAAGG